ncbi:MAG: hypothetical protein QOF60_933 [Actinomycetota bacterium]|nr:hypothetical protein [Actinomycetota bacterium]
MFEHLDIKEHIEGGHGLPSGGPERQRIIAVTEMIATLFEHVFLERASMPDDLWTSWQGFMSDYATQVAFNEYFDIRASWYSKPFLKFLGRE